MAHYAKYTKGSAGSLTRHYERAKNSRGEYLKFKNEEIDPTRTYLNYNLAPHQQGQLDFIKERLENVHCLKRDDVKVMCSWVVTVPKTVPEEHQREFFQEVYKHLEGRYGKQNVISAYVHMDETTPHMHFAFVPVVYDRKKNREKVSAKECVTRADLKEFHTDLQAVIDQWKEHKQYEFECDILNGATDSGNLTVQGLKAKELEEQNEVAAEVLNDMTEQCNEVGFNAQVLQDDVDSLTEQRERLTESVADLERVQKSIEGDIKALESKLDTLNSSRETIIMRFINLPKIKPIFEKFCKDWLEQIQQQKAEREERRSTIGTLEMYKEQIAKQKTDNPMPTDSKNRHHSKDKGER